MPADPAASPDIPSAWQALALDLPAFHAPLSAGETEPFVGRLAALPAVEVGMAGALPDEAARLLALDVLMVEAAVRRHELALPAPVAAALDASSAVVAERMGLEPIISYPLYIRHNPTALGETRRFTPLEAEYRFIRMHRLIEDRFDRLIARIEAVLGADDSRAALRAAMPDLRAGFRLVNRTMAGFRGVQRMPVDDFVQGFRPYYGPRLDPETGELLLDGPSGLQSPTYRIIAMRIGYRDRVLDGWTETIGHYHEPETRRRLAAARAERDAGRALTSVCDAILGPAPDLPHLHPDYAADIPTLLAVAQRCGYVSADVGRTFDRFALALGEWPEEAPAEGRVQRVPAPGDLGEADRADLAQLVEIEAMLFGMHLEHVATAAVQIGAIRGTGGTAGVEFLLIATFRRAFPKLWASGLGAALARDIPALQRG